MTTLSADLRRRLERTIMQARDVAETGARAALEALAVAEAQPYERDLFAVGDTLLSAQLRGSLDALHDLFRQAPLLGSLIDPRTLKRELFQGDYESVQALFAAAAASERATFEQTERAVAAQGMAHAAELLAGRYHLVITNVPYLVRRKQDEKLRAFCGTFFALRLSNPEDRARVRGTLPDGLVGLLDVLPILRTGEAIVTGEAAKLPMRCRVTLPSKKHRPRSEDPEISKKWRLQRREEGWVVASWRSQSPIAVTKELNLQRTQVEDDSAVD